MVELVTLLPEVEKEEAEAAATKEEVVIEVEIEVADTLKVVICHPEAVEAMKEMTIAGTRDPEETTMTIDN